MINLIVVPNQAPMTWEDFLGTYGPYSIAIDGFVREGPRKNMKVPALNMNHHEGTPRYETFATCQQALSKVREGLMRKYFVKDGKPHANVVTLSCDEDVALTYTILNNAWMFESSTNPKINKLTNVEGFLDITAGAGALHPDMPFLKEIAWIFHPYTDFKKRGGLVAKDSEAYKQVIYQIEERIIRYVADKAGTIEVSSSQYKQAGGDKSVALVTDVGQFGRMAMSYDGIEAYVSFTRIGEDLYDIVLGTLNSLVDIDIVSVLSKLNEEETNGGRWGGGDGVGGCDRALGTRIHPERVLQLMKESYGN